MGKRNEKRCPPIKDFVSLARRKVIYTLEGDRGTMRVEDDAIEVRTRKTDRTRSTQAGRFGQASQSGGGWENRRDRVSSDWRDASQVHGFTSLLDQFRAAIEKKEYVGKEAQDSLR